MRVKRTVTPRVEDLLNQYLDSHRVIGTSEKTLEGYEFQVRRLLKWAGESPEVIGADGL